MVRDGRISPSFLHATRESSQVFKYFFTTKTLPVYGLGYWMREGKMGVSSCNPLPSCQPLARIALNPLSLRFAQSLSRSGAFHHLMFKWLKSKKKREENAPITSPERLAKLEATVVRLDAEILDLVVSMETMRNKVLRKIQFKKEEPEEPKKEKESFYSSVLLPEHGSPK